RVGIQRLGDQLFTHFRPVGVGCVDQVDAELDGAPQYPDRLVPVLRLAPDTGTGDLHRAEAQPGHGPVPAAGEGTAQFHSLGHLSSLHVYVQHLRAGTGARPQARTTSTAESDWLAKTRSAMTPAARRSAPAARAGSSDGPETAARATSARIETR